MHRRSFSCDSDAGAVFHVEARDAESLHGRGDLARDRLRRADVERAVIGFAVELRASHRRPAALGADPVAHALVVGPQLLARLLVGVRDIAGRVHADGLHGLAELLEGAVVEIDIGPEPLADRRR